MSKFYVTAGSRSAIVDVANFDEAYHEAVSKCDQAFATLPVFITERATGRVRKVISICPECSIHVFHDDEWMLTDKANEWQHVDCDRTDRI